MTAPPVVSLHVWRVPRRDVVAAMARLPVLRREARRATGVTFAKVLGTADATFTPQGVTITRWALLAAWTDAAASTDFRAAASMRWWDAHARESARLLMRPVRSRGRWDGRAPFGDGTPGDDGDAGARPVVALTRASLRAGGALRFYRAVPAIAAEVAHASGLRVAFGVGEAPLLRQGTVSIWDDVHRMQAFAHTPAHAEAVRTTPAARWYAEELFARFAIIDAVGTIDGRGVAA